MKKQLLSLLALVGVCTLSADGGLVHRYDFSVDASDSVGTAHGTLGTGTIADGALKTDGSNTGVTLTSDAVAGITGAFTIETWFDAFQPQGGYRTLYSFSDGTRDNFIIATPARLDGGQPWQASVHVKVDGVTDSMMRGEPMDIGGMRRMTVTYDGTTLKYYMEGQIAFLEGGDISPFNNFDCPGLNLQAVSSSIGISANSPWGDPSMIGDIYDFRIYDHALTADQISTTFALGVDASNEAISAAVPEPATMSIIGLGALAMLRRRK